MRWGHLVARSHLLRLFRLLAVLPLLAGPGASAVLAAPKVDIVTIEKGDRLTCEIKGLERGRLTVSTDPLDTVAVYWERIEQLASTRLYEVELSDGQRYFGALGGTVPRRLLVGVGAGAMDLAMDDVIRITPLEAGFWHRIDGNIDAGFSFNKADLETRWTLNAAAEYRSRSYEGKLTLTSQLTVREDADELSRNALSLAGRRLFGRRWFGVLIGQLQENQELSLDLRSVVGGGAGRYLVQSNSTVLQVFSGLVYTREHFSDGSGRNSPELALGTTWDWFSARSNDIDLSTTAIGYFNVGGQGRTRFELQSALRFEFLKDFYCSVNGYNSVDSDPPEGSAHADAGLSLTLGWKF
jgi:hypothetical protein